jgi:hypothetical protein
MGFHVSVVKRVGKEVQVNVWGDGIALSLPLERYLSILIDESGVDGERVKRVSAEIITAIKNESGKYVK